MENKLPEGPEGLFAQEVLLAFHQVIPEMDEIAVIRLFPRDGKLLHEIIGYCGPRGIEEVHKSFVTDLTTGPDGLRAKLLLMYKNPTVKPEDIEWEEAAEGNMWDGLGFLERPSEKEAVFVVFNATKSSAAEIWLKEAVSGSSVTNLSIEKIFGRIRPILVDRAAKRLENAVSGITDIE